MLLDRAEICEADVALVSVDWQSGVHAVRGDKQLNTGLLNCDEDAVCARTEKKDGARKLVSGCNLPGVQESKIRASAHGNTNLDELREHSQ